ncbi:MAG: hypothetical protein PF439_04070 [Helicobacteraceae bacterium]|jgi:predicted glycosyltransferase involved in capsule biosynthesis|nr:hypothetical protein [Helicobacteraceae bacterium]
MKYIFFISVMFVFVFTGCTKEDKIVHTLDCIIDSVVYVETGRTVTLTKEDAVKNGFEYHFKVYNNDTVLVNDADTYVKDDNMERSYSLQREKNIDANMKFQFSKPFDDVKFLIVNKNMEYTYTCSMNH